MTEHTVAFIAQPSPVAPTLGTLRRAAGKLFPNRPIRIELAPGLEPETGRLLVRLNGVLLALIAVPSSLPRPVWADAATASVWPDAIVAMEQHRAHIVVAAVESTKSHPEALAAALAITIVAALLCVNDQATAVVWDNAGTLTRPDMFLRSAQQLLENDRLEAIPTESWVRISWTRGDDADMIGAVTTGLVPFVGREVEFEPTLLPLAELARRVTGIAAYLIRHGPVIGDGETLETGPGEIVRASHVTRGSEAAVPVLTLRLEKRGEAG